MAVADKKVLGWGSTSSDQALVVSFFLILLCARSPGSLSPNPDALW